MLQQDQKTLLNPDTLLYSELEYFLKTSLSSSTAKIISCYMLSNPHLTEQFKTDCLVLQSLVDSNDLVGGNTEEDVIRRGYQFNKGLLFPIGQFQPKSII
jgi:hypothetical protein